MSTIKRNPRAAALATPAEPAPVPTRHRRGHGRATLQDVAQQAGVTAITVSRYLRQPERVAPVTARAVAAALLATGYLPNRPGLQADRVGLHADVPTERGSTAG